jgi:hypothetical protein
MNILILFSLIYNSSIQSLVVEFHQLNGEKEEQNFINKYKSENSPGVKAYVYSLEMKKAEYSFNPVEKLTIFNRYRNKFEDLISKHPSNIHLRYMRLTIQEKLPQILGYYSSIEADKQFLKQKMETKDASDYMDVFIKHNTSL